MKKKNLKLNFSKETIAKLQMKEINGGALWTLFCKTEDTCETNCQQVTCYSLNPNDACQSNVESVELCNCPNGTVR
jgi:hypothetical protein